MKGKTALRLVIIAGVLYGLYCINKDGSLTDGAPELDAEREQLKKDLAEDIRKAEEKAKELAAAVKDVIRTAEETVQTEEAQEQPAADEQPVGIPNPFRELPEAEFRAQCPKELNYEDINEDSPFFYTIDGEKTLYGIRLRDADCLEYDFRMVRGRGDADISGMYYDWTQEIKYPENKPECTIYLNEAGQGICLWKDRSYRYSLSLKEGASLVKLAWMRKRIMSI